MPFKPGISGNPSTQFKPGESGNPTGPKPGYKHLSTWIQELLNDKNFKATTREGLKIVEYKGAPIKAIVNAQIRLAVNGDAKAFDVLGKYGYGSNVPNNPEEINVKYEIVNRIPEPKE